MDKEKAKFLLQSFRPDGADSSDPEFSEALALAAADRDLGDWLAKERASDAAFAAMLNDVEIPEDLRESLFAALAGEAQSAELDEADASFAGALLSINAPTGLREQILNAMEAESAIGKVVPMAQSTPNRVSRWLATAAVAAAVVLGAFVALKVPTGNGVSPALVERSAIGLFDASFSLDEMGTKPESLKTWLASHELPTPGVLPAGLESSPSLGCKEIEIGGKPASLICFESKEGVVHLIVLKREDVKSSLPAMADADCIGCKKTGWARVSWEEDDKALFLLGEMDKERLEKVLF